MKENNQYQNWSKEELVAEIKKLKKRKKYGIVWEEKPEDVAELCKEKLPVIEENKRKEIKTDKKKPINILIEGDNYHALSVLNYTHNGKIDVIYIDPPYNTGNKDFIYNDKYVDLEDNYRHSKWLAFMEKRLKLAKGVLKNTGMIFVSIDENEFAQLKLLLDEIFGERNFINFISIKAKVSSGASGGGEDKKIKKNTEFLLFYSKNRKYFNYTPIYKTTPIDEYIEEHKKNNIGFYYTRVLVNIGKKELIREVGGIKIYRHSKYKFDSVNNIMKKEGISLGEVYTKYFDKIFMVTNAQTSILGKVNNIVSEKGQLVSYQYIPKTGRNKGRVTTRYIWNKTLVVWLSDSAKLEKGKVKKLQEIGTLWDDISWGRLDLEGSVVFKSGKKPVALIKRILQLYPYENAIILDFFAGSGSTGHAVLELNQEDKQSRQFILCTDDENKICNEKTYPRMINVIKGLKNRKGLGGNLKYFTTTFVDAKPTDKNKKELVDKSTEMLCLRESCFEGVKKGRDFRIFKNNQSKYLGIIYSDEGIELFKKEVKKLNKKFTVYVFSLDESAREEEFEDVKKLVELRPIPAVILNVYKRIFK